MPTDSISALNIIQQLKLRDLDRQEHQHEDELTFGDPPTETAVPYGDNNISVLSIPPTGAGGQLLLTNDQALSNAIDEVRSSIASIPTSPVTAVTNGNGLNLSSGTLSFNNSNYVTTDAFGNCGITGVLTAQNLEITTGQFVFGGEAIYSEGGTNILDNGTGGMFVRGELMTNNSTLDDSNGNTIISGTCTASGFVGDGSNLTNLPAPDLSGVLPLSGGTLTGQLTGPGGNTFDDGSGNMVVTGRVTATSLEFGNSTIQTTAFLGYDASNLTGSLPALVGTALTSLNASHVTLGTVATARLGSGTASSSTFLRGDQTWATVSSGAVSSVTNGNGLNLSSGTLSFNGSIYALASSLSSYLPLSGGVMTSGAVIQWGIGGMTLEGDSDGKLVSKNNVLDDGSGSMVLFGQLTGRGGNTFDDGLGNAGIQSLLTFGTVNGGTSIGFNTGGTIGDNSAGGVLIGGPLSLQGVAPQLVTKTNAYTANSQDSTILVNGAAKTITLPDVTVTSVTPVGRIYTIKLIAASTTGTVAAHTGQTIDGASTYTLSAQYAYVTLQSNGANWEIIASSTNVGTGTNNNASAGYIGEYVTASLAAGSALTVTANTPLNVTSISLTAGDWDVEGTVDYHQSATGAVSAVKQGISTTSATLGAQDTFSCAAMTATFFNESVDMATPTPTVRLPLSTTTTVYLVGYVNTISGSTITAYGTIRATRRR